MKHITKKIGVLILFTLLVSIIVPNTEAKAATSYKGRTITSDVSATYADTDRKKIEFSEVNGTYKFVYTVNLYNFLYPSDQSYVSCELSSVKIYKKQGSSYVKATKNDTVDMLEIPTYISVPNITFKESYYDDGRTKTLKAHKIKLIAKVDTKDDDNSLNDSSFFSNSFDCTVNTLIVPFDDPAFDLAESWFNGFGGHIGTIVIAGTEYNDTTNYPNNLFNYIDYYSIEKTISDSFYANVEGGYMSLDDCKKYFEENNLLSYYNDVFLTKKDSKRADFTSALKGVYKADTSTTNIEVVETPTTSSSNTALESGYGTYSNLDTTKKEYLSILTDGSYCLYTKNNKGNIVRYELVLLKDDTISIPNISIYQNTEDYLEEKEFESIEKSSSLGHIEIPSSVTLANKKYTVVKTAGVNQVSDYYLDGLTLPDTIKETIALQGDEAYFTKMPIKTLTISKSMKTVCPNFLNNVTAVKLNTDNPYLSYASGFLYSKDYKTLYGTVDKKVRNVSIKSTVQTIEKNSLNNLWIYQGGTITFPSSLKSIKSQENWRNETGAIITSKQDYTIQFKSVAPPKVESFKMLKNYYIITPNSTTAINAYKALKDSDGNKVFTSEYIVTKHYYKNLSVLTPLQKDLKKLTAKPSEVSSTDWKYIVSKAKSLTKGCKTDTEKLKAIDTYVRSLKLNESAKEYYNAKTIYGSFDYVALIKESQYYGESSLGLFGLLTKAVGIASVNTCTLNTDLFSTYTYNYAILLNDKTWVFFRFDGDKINYNTNYMVNHLAFFTQDCGKGEKIGTLITIFDEYK